MLADCLETLQAQRNPPRDWEIVVVNNGSDLLEPVIERFTAAGLPARCARQEKQGLNAARNCGLEQSEGEIVAFLDDDTLVDPGWAAAMHAAFERNDCHAVGGRVQLKLEDGAELPAWLTPRRVSYLSSYDLGAAPSYVHRPPLPVGANFGLLRRGLEPLGGFREELDRVGFDLSSNGEFELLRRLLASGGRVVYWPAARVLHRVGPERTTKDWFRRRARAQGVSDARMDPLDGRSATRRIARESLRTGRAAPILARRLIEGRGTFDAELWLIACRARVAELQKQRRGHD